VGSLDPEAVVTPGIFVDRVVKTTMHFDIGVMRNILSMVGRVNNGGRTRDPRGRAGRTASFQCY
jgi:hypothetical protein